MVRVKALSIFVFESIDKPFYFVNQVRLKLSKYTIMPVFINGSCKVQREKLNSGFIIRLIRICFLKLKSIFPFAVFNVIVTAIGGKNSVMDAERFENEIIKYLK